MKKMKKIKKTVKKVKHPAVPTRRGRDGTTCFAGASASGGLATTFLRPPKRATRRREAGSLLASAEPLAKPGRNSPKPQPSFAKATRRRRIKEKDTLLYSLDPLPKEHYIRVPLQIRKDYGKVAMKMRAIPAKKAKMAFDLTVKLWKPVVMELRTDFEKQRQARELPHNMKFTDYFLQFQRAADRESRKKHAPKKAARSAKPKKRRKH